MAAAGLVAAGLAAAAMGQDPYVRWLGVSMAASGLLGLRGLGDAAPLAPLAAAGGLLAVSSGSVVGVVLGLEAVAAAVVGLCASRGSAGALLSYYYAGLLAAPLLVLAAALGGGVVSSSLALLGAAAEAGLLPFSFWLPLVYGAAPAWRLATAAAVAEPPALMVLARFASQGPVLLALALAAATGGYAAAGLAYASRRGDGRRLLAYNSVMEAGVVAAASALGAAGGWAVGFFSVATGLAVAAVLASGPEAPPGALGLMVAAGSPPFAVFSAKLLLVYLVATRSPLAGGLVGLGLAVSGAALAAHALRVASRSEETWGWIPVALYGLLLVMGVAPGILVPW